MKLLASIKGKAFELTQLQIRVPIDVDSDEDAKFITEFLSAFRQFRSLSLHLQTIEDDSILIPIGKQIKSLPKLQKLELSVIITSQGNLMSFLPCIDRLTGLQQISLTLNTVSKDAWQRRAEDIFQVLKPLLLQSKLLKKDIFELESIHSTMHSSFEVGHKRDEQFRFLLSRIFIIFKSADSGKDTCSI